MHIPISQQDYLHEINRMIGVSIDRINILSDPQLRIQGFSLIHILDHEKKLGIILGLKGTLSFWGNKLTLDLTTSYYAKARQIKQTILENKLTIQKIDCEGGSNKVVLTFSDGSQLTAKTNSSETKPLSFDNDVQGYAIYFGEKVVGDGTYDYFKTIF